ncbi:MAG TPA: flagellar hook-length control protein FliK, partial [Janthinobacterium sp.]|nr:flagellar hook-length control protein FliK [Janthinobacterium sp.]
SGAALPAAAAPVAAPHLAAAMPAAAEPAPAPAAADASSAAPAIAWAAAPVANPAPSGADTLVLSGPSQQWQQPLQQALGDRLQTQISNNSQQAVIRLDPPNLGSIEIAIRHSDGALQVNLSASNSEVLRQLRSIGDSVRQDLSSRQYSEVAVTVSPTPRSAAAQSFADDGGGRQRQTGQDADENAPGRALAEAGQPDGAFALNDRE